MPSPSRLLPLRGVRIVSLALNLPGPAALMRLRALFAQAGLPPPDARAPFAPAARAAIAAWAAGKTRQQLNALAAAHDIPLFTLS